jgi:hypothetical protein
MAKKKGGPPELELEAHYILPPRPQPHVDDPDDHMVYATKYAGMAIEIARLKDENGRLRRDLDASRAARDAETARLRAVEKERDTLREALVREFENHISEALKGISFNNNDKQETFVKVITEAIIEKMKIHPQLMPKVDVRVEHSYDENTGDVHMEMRVSTDDPFLRQRLLDSGFEPLTEDDELHPSGKCTCAGEGECMWCQTHCLHCGATPDQHGPGSTHYFAPHGGEVVDPRDEPCSKCGEAGMYCTCDGEDFGDGSSPWERGEK